MVRPIPAFKIREANPYHDPATGEFTTKGSLKGESIESLVTQARAKPTIENMISAGTAIWEHAESKRTVTRGDVEAAWKASKAAEEKWASARGPEATALYAEYKTARTLHEQLSRTESTEVQRVIESTLAQHVKFGSGSLVVYTQSGTKSATTKAIQAEVERLPQKWNDTAKQLNNMLLADKTGGQRGGFEPDPKPRSSPGPQRQIIRVPSTGGVSPVFVQHELGHFYEETNPAIGAAAKAFFVRRAAGQPVTRLTVFEDGANPSDTVRDHWPDAYCGKVIGSPERPVATELVSMGLQYRTRGWKEFGDDHEYRAFITGLMVATG